MNFDVKVEQSIDRWLASRRERIEEPLRRCESPIEQLFLMALVNDPLCDIVREPDCCEVYARNSDSVGALAREVPILNVSYIYVYQQFTLELKKRKMRLDFALFCRSAKVAVELDGHDFHERTKEQARNDKSRDRLLQAAGWQVLRFTGSEVWANADACAAEAINTAFRIGDGG